MTSEKSRAPRGVVARLVREGYMFDFFQSVRLLEGFYSEERSPGETVDVAEERIRFRPHNGLVFPATDVRSIKFLNDPKERVQITSTFMGLYGIDSPLPVYFYDTIATESDDSQVLRDFLDMFNHRLYFLFYRSWKKYRLPLQYSTSSTRENLAVRALSFAGLGTRKAVDDSFMPAMRLAGFAGVLSSRVRHAEGLRNLLVEFLGGVEVGVVENVPRWVLIRQRSPMGRQSALRSTLGSSACIGERVYDVSGKFRVVVGPLSLRQYLELLPGGASARLVQFLVRLYVRDFLDYDIQLILRTGEIPVFKLGDRSSKLGLTTWLGRPQTETTARVVALN